MALYNISQIIGKTLIAAKKLDIVRLPQDDAPSVFEVAKGQSIGKVESYVLPREGRAYLYWMFLDSFKVAYWVKHDSNAFSIKDQGILTVKEQAELDAKAKTILERAGELIEGGAENAAEVGDTLTFAIKAVAIGGVAFLGLKAWEAATGKNIVQSFKERK